jgi:hypothetical protein
MKRITIEFYLSDAYGEVRGYMHPYNPEHFGRMGPWATQEWKEWEEAVTRCEGLLYFPQPNPVVLHRSMPADKMLSAMAVLRLQGFNVVQYIPEIGGQE